jgi:adenylate cyclase
MSTPTIERKLTAVMAADVAGYSRMMGEDEAGTMAALSECRILMMGFITRHRGRVANTAGDSVLAEFPSVADSVQAAAEIQRELGERNATLPDARQMQFRIGINLGDVMVKDGDLFGEGVNVAARLQEMAPPGGICISGPVYDQVRNKLSMAYEFLGVKAVKNIATEVPIYRVVLNPDEAARLGDAAAAGPAHGSAGRPLPPPVEPPPVFADIGAVKLVRSLAIGVVLILFLGALDLTQDGDIDWAQWPALGLGLMMAMRGIRYWFDTPKPQRDRAFAGLRSGRRPGHPPEPPPPPTLPR